MQHPYSYDYIKYLNDEAAHGMTYDQWKFKSLHKGTVKCKQCGNEKDPFEKCPKCKF